MNSVLLKNDFLNILFPSTLCSSDAYGDTGRVTAWNYRYLSPSKITAIQLCTVDGWNFNELTGGFIFYVDGVEQPRVACLSANLLLPHPFPLITFDNDEYVLRVDFYTGIQSGYMVLKGLTFHTTSQTYGPYGLLSSTTMNSVSGYNLQGFHGFNGGVIDKIGANFERCWINTH